MRTPLVFDTSIYVPYLRSGTHEHEVRRALRSGHIRMSVVVLAELYAGTRGPKDKADLDVVHRSYGSLGCLIVPSGDDWTTAGQAVARYRRLAGALVPREHLNDILILTSAARAGATVVTNNLDDFSRWARLLRRMGLTANFRPPLT